MTATLSSCVSTAIDPSTMSSTEIAIRQEQTEDIRIAQGVVTGAALGAAGGALIAALAGGDSSDITRGAIAGGLVGGVAGGIDANNVNQNARAEANEQQRYRTVIANADQNIARYRRATGRASALVGEANERVTRLNGELSTGSIDTATYRKKLANARGNVAVVDLQIGRVDRDINDLRAQGRDGVPTGSKVAELQAEKSRLIYQRNALKTAYSRVPEEVGLDV